MRLLGYLTALGELRGLQRELPCNNANIIATAGAVCRHHAAVAHDQLLSLHQAACHAITVFTLSASAYQQECAHQNVPTNDT